MLSRGYLNIDFDAQTTGAVETTGVTVNNSTGYNTSVSAITVDGVDATTKFSVNDDVFDDTGALVGTVATVTATSIIFDENLKVVLNNNEVLKRHKIPASTVRKRSIWANEESFTLEAIITPYDVNGHGSKAANVHGILDSTKTAPYPSDALANREANYYSVSILKDDDYLTQKMMIFYNEKLKFYLQNTTLSSYNQPAEYKIVAEMKDGNDNWQVFASDAVILAEDTLFGYYDATGYYIDKATNRRRVSASATGSNPQGTATISSTSLPSNTRATGQVAFSGVPAHYTSPVNATGSITIANQNNLKVDTDAVGETTTVKFSANPVASDNTDANNYIQIVSEDGGTTTKWFARSTGTNGAALSGSNGTFTWPAGARQYNIGELSDTAAKFSTAVAGYNEGFLGTVNSAAEIPAAFEGGNSSWDVVMTAQIQGSTPNKIGATSATISFGSSYASHNNGSGATITAPNFHSGVNQLVRGESTGSPDTDINYISITDSANTTKNYMPSETKSTGSTGTRTLDDGSTVSVVYFNWGGVNQNSNCATALKNAINHANGHPSTITATVASAVVNLSHDIIGTAGNSAALAKTNTADSVATISGANFTGGVNEANATNTPYIEIIDGAGSPVTKKYVPVKSGDAIATGATQNIGSVSGAVAFQVGADATATGNSLDSAIEHANGHNGSIISVASSGTLSLTQTTAGTGGNTTITLSNTSNTTKTNFANGATPASYIEITDHAGTSKKYKAATTEVNNSTDGTYVFYRNGSDTTESATNLKNAINHSNGHNGTIIATSSSNVVTYKLNNTSVGSGAVQLVSISSGVTLSNPVFSTNTKEITVGSGEADDLGKGNKIYDSSNKDIGTVDSVSGQTITLLADPAIPVTSTIYTTQPKEAFYLEQPMKISLVYLKNGSVELYLNNNLVKKSTHTIGTFTLGQSDCKIGRGQFDSAVGDKEQFFGEIFEIAMHKGKKPCSTTNTLTPGYSDILFYYTFGDV